MSRPHLVARGTETRLKLRATKTGGLRFGAHTAYGFTSSFQLLSSQTTTMLNEMAERSLTLFADY